MSGLKLANELSNSFANFTVNVYVNPEIEHFILLNDVLEPINH